MATLPLIVFDVNETLLDLETMEPIFQRIFGETPLISRERPGQGATHSSTEARTLSRSALRLGPRPRPNFGAGASYDRPRGMTFNEICASPPTTRFKPLSL
jgi:hypothetical protein